MSAFGTGSNSNGNFWYGNSSNFPGFLYKKNNNVGGRRSTKFNPGGNVICNTYQYLYNKYKPGTGGVGASSTSNRRAKNRLATICNANNCFPYYMSLGQYSNYTHNPNGFVLPIFTQQGSNIKSNSIVIDGVTRNYITINIDLNRLNRYSVLLCFHGRTETMNDFLSYTNFGVMGSSAIIFQGQNCVDTTTFQNSVPWIYKVGTQNDILFVDTVLNKIYNNFIPRNIFLTGKSDGAGFSILYSNMSAYKSRIKAIGICSSAHFGINSSSNISTFLQSNYYNYSNNIIIPYNIIVPPKHISMFIIHGTGDTVMPYYGQNYIDKAAYKYESTSNWKNVDPTLNEINDVVNSNTFTVNFPDYFDFIEKNNNLNQIYNNSNNAYSWTVNTNTNNMVLNTITINGQDHSWSGHYNSGPNSSYSQNFNLDSTYLLIKFFELEQGGYVPTTSTIPPNLKTYTNKIII